MPTQIKQARSTIGKEKETFRKKVEVTVEASHIRKEERLNNSVAPPFLIASIYILKLRWPIASGCRFGIVMARSHFRLRTQRSDFFYLEFNTTNKIL